VRVKLQMNEMILKSYCSVSVKQHVSMCGSIYHKRYKKKTFVQSERKFKVSETIKVMK